MGHQPGYLKQRASRLRMQKIRNSRYPTTFSIQEKDIILPQPAQNTPLSARLRIQTSFYAPPVNHQVRRESRGCVKCCLRNEDLVSSVTTSPSIGALVHHVNNDAVSLNMCSSTQPLSVTVDELFCGIGAGRSAVRWLNKHKRRNRLDHNFVVTSALDANTRLRPKTDLYNATCRKNDVLARNLRIESSESMQQARSGRKPLLTLAGLPCGDLSRLGSCKGVIKGTTHDAFTGFFKHLDITRSPLLIIEEVDALLHNSNVASFAFITRNLERCGYHWRVRILNAAEYGSAQQRKRAYLVCAHDVAVLTSFSWPSLSHKRIVSFDKSLEIFGEEDREGLSLNLNSKVAQTLLHPITGLQRPVRNQLFSSVSSVYGNNVVVLSRRRKTIGTITASRTSGLYLYEGPLLRRLSGVEALRFFTFSSEEVLEYAAAAKNLGITSVELAELAGDAFVVIVVAKLMRGLVDAYKEVASIMKE